MFRLGLIISIFIMSACNTPGHKSDSSSGKNLNTILENYYAEREKLFPLEATTTGNNQYNDLLQIDITRDFQDSLDRFYRKYSDSVALIDTAALNENDLLSYKIFQWEAGMQREAISLGIVNPGGMVFMSAPFQQFWGLPITIGQLAGGSGSQPFKTEKDYRNWLSRLETFSTWCDTAMSQFRKGMASGFTLPRALVIKMIPQLEASAGNDTATNIFYSPVKNFPSSFSDSAKNALYNDYVQVITNKIVPAYQRMVSFFKETYLPAARASVGISEVPNGDSIYRFAIRFWTTTDKTIDDIYNTGLEEVARTKQKMDSVMKSTGFKGNLEEFFTYLRTDKKFKPFHNPTEVLDAFRKMKSIIDPRLDSLFGKTPLAPFEIRQTEAFRAGSASAEYNQGSADGSRPGIFYVPIINASQFNVTSGMESLFLHEAIPGHHYQISLQQENTSLPKFRRFAWYGAMGEGWALYCESLGKELGLYTDPYQYFGALGDDIHRGIRLVVDIGMHVKGMSREEAIKYMMDNEAIDEAGATAEIERYIAIPGQALSYKVGALKIRELREKYRQQLGDKFDIAAFHDELLKDGVMPLDIMEDKMDRWAKGGE